MKKLLSVLSVFALAAIAAGTASAGSIATPAGLNPGEQFRFVFLSTTTTNATSSDLSTYDSIVSSDANGYTYGATSPIWKAIVSNATIDARVHIGLLPTSSTPLFTVDGTQVSSGNLWSGSLMNPINIGIHGSQSALFYTWTGTQVDGTRSPTGPMGAAGDVSSGKAYSTGPEWVDDEMPISSISYYNVYGISEVLTVPSTVPEPSTAMLAGLGGLAALVYSFKRKRN